MVICLEQGADLHTAQLMPLPFTASCFSKIQMVLPFWYRLTRVVPDKGPLNGCMYVCMFLSMKHWSSSYILGLHMLAVFITARCYASAVLAMGLCLSVSVCLSITSRSSTKTAKRGITQTTPHDTPGDSSFLMPKISAKFDRGHPLRGRRMQVGWVKIGDFRHISCYISKTVKDRHIVSIKVE